MPRSATSTSTFATSSTCRAAVAGDVETTAGRPTGLAPRQPAERELSGAQSRTGTSRAASVPCRSGLLGALRFQPLSAAPFHPQLRESNDAHNGDHGGAGDCRDEQRRAERDGSAEAEVVHRYLVLVLQDQDDEQHQEPVSYTHLRAHET